MRASAPGTPASLAVLAGLVALTAASAGGLDPRAAGSAAAHEPSSAPGRSAAAPGVAALPSRLVIGRSARGRAIVARRYGDPGAERVALAVGVVHGDERAGHEVLKRIPRGRLRGTQLWVIASMNPDGARARTRKNARGVDLNRNFPHRWRRGAPASSGHHPGRRPASERETRAVMRFMRRIRPDVSVHYHQPWGAVLACRGRPAIAARYARLAGMRTSCRGRGLPGTAIGWQRARVGGSAFVVELPAGRISGAAARRHGRALAAIASQDSRASAAASGKGAHPARARVPRPAIRKRLIPYPKRRRAQMAAYSKRHYGAREAALTKPKLIVIHYAVAPTIGSIYNTFAANRPDPEYGERPGVCSHYAVGAGGRTVRLVPDRLRCRHVVGLNHVSLGIEHVGYSDADVLGNKRELRASLRLVRWLRCRNGIPVKQVIGHNESLRSRFYRELDPRFRGRTHGDFPTRAMRVYRRALKRLGPC